MPACLELERGIHLGLAALLSLAACTRAQPRDALLILGTTRDPATLDPAFAQLSREQEMVRLLFRDLTVLDERWQLQPDLADALPLARTSSAGFTVRWKLRPNLKWSDGRSLTAEDVRFGWSIERDPALQAVSFETAQKVKAIDVQGPSTFDVRWGEPFADYQAPRVHAVLPQHAYPKPNPARPFTGMQRAPVGNGPFRFVSRVPGQSVHFERNPYWRGPRPALDRIIFRIFPSEDGFEAALATGAIHALGEASGLTPDRVRALKDRLAPSHDVLSAPGGVLLHLDLRHDHPGLAHRAVREALLQAIDRPALAQVTYDGLATPAEGLFPPRHPGFSAAAQAKGYDPKAATAAMKTRSAKERRLTLDIGSGSGAAARAGAFIQAALNEVGFDVDLRTAPMSTLFSQMRAGQHAPLVLYAWRVRPDWDGASVLATGGRQNYGGYSSAAMDADLRRLKGTLDPSARAALLQRIGARFSEELPAIPLLFRHTVSVRPKALEGWRPTGTVTPVTWSAESWRWRR